MPSRSPVWIALFAGVILSACAVPPITPTPTATPIPTPTDTPTSTLIPTITPTPTPVQIDYGPMIEEINRYLGNTVDKGGYDLGIGFEDTISGQIISIRGDDRYHAMSSFKGPLAVMYLSLLEQGKIKEQPGDDRNLTLMLKVSANGDTTCILERVGGLPAFNDWLAEQGLSRDHNFVFDWSEWSCYERDTGRFYASTPDWRYSTGDEALGLPANQLLLRCPLPQLPCDKAFSPAELAHFYARLYRGEILNPASLERYKAYVKRVINEAVFYNLLPEGWEAVAYIKGGTRERDEEYRVNFFSEAGWLETPHGAFALALFMQRNPSWPGTDPMSRVAQIAYSHFTAAHPTK